MPSFVSNVAAFVLLAGVCIPLTAASEPPHRVAGEQASSRPVNMDIVNGSDFMHYHPDVRYRRDGMQLFEAGDHASAFDRFRRAARYSDKPAQAMMAEMLWDGRGMPADRCLAYIWMDLAAERGYPVFLSFRERYWAALDTAERACAVEQGAAIHAEYGDAAAKPRLEHMLRKRRMRFTGSRVGYVSGYLTVLAPTQSGMWTRIPAHHAYDRRFWQAKAYHAWQDEIWERPVRGVVDVGPLRDAGADATERKDDE